MSEEEKKLDQALETAEQILSGNLECEESGDFDNSGKLTGLDDANDNNLLADEIDDDSWLDEDSILLKDEDTANFEKMSSDELRQEIEKDKKKAIRSLIMAVTALVAIIAICIAWFVANNVVNSGTAAISADANTGFILASVGDRQETELNHYWNTSVKDKILREGTTETYNTYYDIDLKKEVAKSQTYYTGISALAWRDDEQTTLEPGANGTFEFYVIPKTDGLSSVTINLDMEAYVKKTDDDGHMGENAKAVKSSDSKLQNLVNGHILLFRNLDSNAGYSGWIPVTGADTGELTESTIHSFTISAAEAGAGDRFVVNTPYKVTIYWVWPKYFRNYIYGQRALNNDLFIDRTDNNEDNQKLITFVNACADAGLGEKDMLFYETDSGKAVSTQAGSTINKNMSDEILNRYTSYYNQADEYIGTSVNFVYVNATVE